VARPCSPQARDFKNDAEALGDKSPYRKDVQAKQKKAEAQVERSLAQTEALRAELGAFVMPHAKKGEAAYSEELRKQRAAEGGEEALEKVGAPTSHRCNWQV